MKKLLSFCLTISFIASLSGCSLFGGGEEPVIDLQSQSIEDIEASYPSWDQEMMQKYLERDSLVEMSYAGPFYFGSFDGLTPESQNYSDLRRQKVDEVVDIINAGIDKLMDLDKKLRAEKELFVKMIQEIQKIDPSTKEYTNKMLNATDMKDLSQALSNLSVLRNQAAKMDINAAWGFVQFQKYAGVVELTNLYTVEAGSLLNRMTTMSYLLEDDSNPEYQKIHEKFLAVVDPLSEEVATLLNEIYYTNALIHYGEQFLFTSDYYYIKDSLVRIDNEIAKSEKLFAEYQGGNEMLDEEWVALLKTKLEDMKNYRNKIMAYIESIPSDALLSDDVFAYSSPSIIPVAKAKTDPSFLSPGWAQKKISNGVKWVKFGKDMTFAAVRVAGKKAKNLYDKSGAHELIKDGAQMANTVLEGVNSTVEISIYGLQGLYYGDMTWADFKKKIEDEKKEVYERFVKGTLGKEQYDEVIHQVDQFQAKTQKFVDNMSDFSGDMTGILSGSPEVGKFVKKIVRNVGNETKGVLDKATSFTKNMAIVMHPTTTKEQTRNAMLEIYATLQSIRDEEGELETVEIPDLIETTKKEIAKELGLNEEEEKAFGEKLKEKLTEMFKDELKKAEDKEKVKKKDKKPSKELEKIYTDPTLTDKQIRDLILQEILRGLPPIKGAKDSEDAKKDNDKDGVINKDDNCVDTANPDQVDTNKDSIGDVCDPACSGDVDGDTICNELDNCPQKPNTDQKDSDNDLIGNLCDDDAPMLSEIAGSWPGTVKITEVYISPEFRESADGEGCDIEEVEKTKDQVKPITITISPTSENGGVLVMDGADQEKKEIPFSYNNGKLTASFSEEDSSANFNMNFSRSTVDGNVDMNFFEGNIKMTATLDLSRE